MSQIHAVKVSLYRRNTDDSGNNTFGRRLEREVELQMLALPHVGDLLDVEGTEYVVDKVLLRTAPAGSWASFGGQLQMGANEALTPLVSAVTECTPNSLDALARGAAEVERLTADVAFQRREVQRALEERDEHRTEAERLKAALARQSCGHPRELRKLRGEVKRWKVAAESKQPALGAELARLRGSEAHLSAEVERQKAHSVLVAASAREACERRDQLQAEVDRQEAEHLDNAGRHIAAEAESERQAKVIAALREEQNRLVRLGFSLARDHAEISTHDGWQTTAPVLDWESAEVKLGDALRALGEEP